MREPCRRCGPREEEKIFYLCWELNPRTSSAQGTHCIGRTVAARSPSCDIHTRNRLQPTTVLQASVMEENTHVPAGNRTPICNVTNLFTASPWLLLTKILHFYIHSCFSRCRIVSIPRWIRFLFRGMKCENARKEVLN